MANTLELAFEKELKQRIEKANTVCGKQPDRFLAQAEKSGMVNAVHQLVRRGQLSETFGPLADCGRLDLSIEAAVTQGRFGALFSDDEVNACFDLLCEYGYFK